MEIIEISSRAEASFKIDNRLHVLNMVLHLSSMRVQVLSSSVLSSSFPLKKILLAIDGSDNAKRAEEVAGRLAKITGQNS